jgi:hypothetical protein
MTANTGIRGASADLVGLLNNPIFYVVRRTSILRALDGPACYHAVDILPILFCCPKRLNHLYCCTHISSPMAFLF